MPGRVSRRDPIGTPSWPPSSSPRSVSIGCATRWALHVAADALDMVERRRRRGRPEPRLEADLLARSRRLRRRLAARDGREPSDDGHAGGRRARNPESRWSDALTGRVHRATFPRPRGSGLWRSGRRGGPVERRGEGSPPNDE
jgi:hypothetical protein